MAKLQFYRQQITPRVTTPDVRGLAAIQSPLAQVGEAISAGAQMIGREVAKRREDEAAIDASARAVSLKSQWLTRSQELETEALQKGELDGYTDRALAAYEELAAKEIQQAKSDRARAWLQEQSANFGLNIQQSSMRWEATAKVNRDVGLANTAFDQARQVVNAQPENYAATRDDLALQYARLPPEKGAEAWSGAKQRLAYDASLGALRANPNAVNEALKKEPGKSGIPYIDDLGADERLQLQAKTETELEQIKREQERVRAERRAALNGRVQNQVALAEVGLMPETLISRAEFVAAGMGDEYENYSQSMRLVPLMNSLANMNRADALAEIEKLKPTREAGAAQAVKRYEYAIKNYEGIVKRQEADPGAFLIEHSPSLRSAYNAMNAAQTPEAMQSAAEEYGRLAVTEAQNIGIQNPAILPKNAAEDLVSRVYATSSKDGSLVGSAAILAEREKWGAYWPNVFAQIAKDLPGSAAVIGAGMRQKPADRLIELSALSEKDLNALLPSNRAPKDVRDEVNNVMTDVFASMYGQQGDAAMIAMLEDSAYRLAIDYVRAGKSVSDAAELAYSEVVGERYVLSEFEDSIIRIPKQKAMDNNVLSTALRIAKSDFIEATGLTRVRDAYWQTLPSDDRVVLMYNREPVEVKIIDGKMRLLTDEERKRNEGVPVTYTWEQLRNMTATRGEAVRGERPWWDLMRIGGLQ
jgi:hypothetical protein